MIQLLENVRHEWASEKRQTSVFISCDDRSEAKFSRKTFLSCSRPVLLESCMAHPSRATDRLRLLRYSGSQQILSLSVARKLEEH